MALSDSRKLDCVFARMSKGKPYAGEKKHSWHTTRYHGCVSLGITGSTTSTRPSCCLIIKAKTDFIPVLGVLVGGVSTVGMASVWEKSGSRFLGNGGPQHFCGAFGLPGGRYKFCLFSYSFVFLFFFFCMFFCAFLFLAILMESCYGIVFCLSLH